MRGWVAISVTATPAAAPRRIREVLRMIIREPSGLRLRPLGLGRREPRPRELHVKYGLVCTARFGNGRLGSAAHHCDGPGEQDMIYAAPARRASSKAPLVFRPSTGGVKPSDAPRSIAQQSASVGLFRGWRSRQ